MKNVFNGLVILTLAALILSSCEAKITDEEEAKEASFSRGIVFKVQCTKFIQINLQDSKIKTTGDANGSGKVARRSGVSDQDFVAEFRYLMTEYKDGSKDMECFLDDGYRQYYGKSSASASTGYLSDNGCEVTYDLNRASGGTFAFYWGTGDRSLTYVDDYENYSKEIFVRSSECSEF